MAFLDIHLTAPDFSPVVVTEDGLLLLSVCEIQSSGTEENRENIADKGVLKEAYSSD